ncbi:MAG: tyrosine-specific transport protein [Gammaproteobacteria bacterium]|nr:tyrosine-specific transport protein [Gammaproteobacteria bacterium]
MIKTNKIIGGIFILTGSAIGAGMLVLPLVGFGSGFVNSAALLLLNWLLMTLTALLTLEASSAFGAYNNSFGAMTKKLLGSMGQVITWFSYLLLLYATTAAYILGGTSLLDLVIKNIFNLELSFWVEATIFTLIFGGIVFWGTHIVDYSVRFLLSIKLILLIFMLVILMPYVDMGNLLDQSFSPKYLWVAAPIFLNDFGFHFLIPSVISYCNCSAKVMQRVIITATTIPLIIYIMWLFVAFGMIPISGALSFTSITHEGSSIGGLTQTLIIIAQSQVVTGCINFFFYIAMTTSFLGVALGVFDFLADGFKRDNTYFGRLQTAALTFLPPFLFVLFYKNGFILALEYSAFFAIILEIFLPAILVCKLRGNGSALSSTYRVPINADFLIVILSGIGLLLMCVVVAERFDLLPTLDGFFS